MVIKKSLFVAVLLFLFLASPVMAASPAAIEIADKLICQCGCGRTLSSHVCDTQEAMMAIIEEKLTEGQSEKKIIQFFVEQYGEAVLSSPPKRGFNLTAWILPFAVILAGGGVIYFSVRRWLRTGKRLQVTVRGESDERDEEYQRQLDKELKDFTDGGFR